jgi:ADP-ribose pyrophosphatase
MSLLSTNRRELVSFMYGVVLTLLIVILFNYYKVHEWGAFNVPNAPVGDTTLEIPMEPFPEAPWRTPQTISARTVTSTPFARFEIHQVRTESGAIIKDWLWTDERSHVNILVHLKAENKYLLFHQKKYGLEKAYYAAIGGLFNNGDNPLDCARRELLEETGLEAEEMISLGRYRVQVNRGGGILYAFLAKNSFVSKQSKPSDDYEKQERRLLSRDELIKVALAGEIGEAQWLSTIALGIVYEEHHEHHRGSNSLPVPV